MQENIEIIRDILLVIFLGIGLVLALAIAIVALLFFKAARRSGQSVKNATVKGKHALAGTVRQITQLPRARRKKHKRKRRSWALPTWSRHSGALALGSGLALALADAQRSRPPRVSRSDDDRSEGPRLVLPDEEPVRRERDKKERQGRKQEIRTQGGMLTLAKELKNEYTRDDLGTIAASLAYRFFLALFPFFIFLAALSGFLAAMLNMENPTGQIIDLLSRTLPPDAAELIGTQLGGILESQNPGLMSIGILGAIWASSSGIQALMKAMNLAYDVPETRTWWKRYALALGLTLVSGLFVVGATVLFFTGQFWAMDIVNALGFEEGWIATLISWARWPLIIALLMGGMAFLYWACPNITLPFKIATPGAIIFVIAWLLASAGFAFYVANFGSYNATYGALGGVVVLLIWMYFSSLLMLLGVEINAIIDDRADPDLMAERRNEKYALERQGRSV